MLLSVGAIKKNYGISRHSLYTWEKQGLIKSYNTPGGKKLYRKDDLDALLGMSEEERETKEKTVCIYARVSTNKQKEYLENQANRLRSYCQSKGYQVTEEVMEIASGVNENRRGLCKVINAAKNGKINKVIIEYEDRLARFGYMYLHTLFDLCGVQIVVVNGQENEDTNKELAEDLIAVVSSFAARVYGKRGGRKK
jgi:predicted site-specific integrase-resolvase